MSQTSQDEDKRVIKGCSRLAVFSRLWFHSNVPYRYFYRILVICVYQLFYNSFKCGLSNKSLNDLSIVIVFVFLLVLFI